MTAEMFDIVDDKNELTGQQKPRSLVHRQNKDWHRVTGTFLVNKSGKILCQLCSAKKDKDPGLWQANFGGHVRAGQTYLQNAVEELKEEIGLIVSPSQLMQLHVRVNPIHKHFAQVFILLWNGQPADLKFSDDEVEQVKWLTLEELESQMAAGKFTGKKLDEKVAEYIENNF